ncbi:hypothetical protein [Acinetobacter pollinis]|uniref:Uncharacterized protein n=1 Tax=Acinetobacter pollinis TaxID=2605270 RepID=A0ABU6DTV1_9GAMM|nr:hypothetical protein [Acinetobacter pollinis]MEB5477281.1 hypothetical protein [Acinetobacter pollinis]
MSEYEIQYLIDQVIQFNSVANEIYYNCYNFCMNYDRRISEFISKSDKNNLDIKEYEVENGYTYYILSDFFDFLESFKTDLSIFNSNYINLLKYLAQEKRDNTTGFIDNVNEIIIIYKRSINSFNLVNSTIISLLENKDFKDINYIRNIDVQFKSIVSNIRSISMAYNKDLGNILTLFLPINHRVLTLDESHEITKRLNNEKHEIEKNKKNNDKVKSNINIELKRIEDEKKIISHKKTKIGLDLIQSEAMLDEVNKLIENTKVLNNQIKGKFTESVYANASKNYLRNAMWMNVFFVVIIVGGGGFGLWLTIQFPVDSEHIINPILQKLFYASAIIVLATFFLRRSVYYSQLGFKAQQISLELEALPFFMKNVENNKQQEIYTNLAEKYFGKELDQTQNYKVADIMQDQMKATIDIAKVTTEMVKSLKDVKSDQDSKKDDSK